MIELMIGLLVTSVIIAGVMGLYVSMLKSSNSLINIGHLDRQLHSVISIMSSDIQRAGYWSQAETSSTNPFMVTGNSDLFVSAGNDCILLTYDHDRDGTLPSISASVDDERYGYRLVGGIIQFRPRGSPFGCTAPANTWQNLTDPNAITVTQFTLAKNEDDIDIDGAGPDTAKITLRNVMITLSGQLVSDATASETLQQTVRVYNDKYTP